MRTNRFIRAHEVRVIDSKGNQLGAMDTRDAVKLAMDEGFDLVEVAPNEVPPVCRILDFGKYQYEEKKKKQESRKTQTKVEVKECKFRPKIGSHDFNVRIRRAVKFLGQGNKVKLTVMFRGREHAHPEIAERLIYRAYEEIKDLGKMEAPPRKEGRDMHCIVAPIREELRKKALKIRAQLAAEGEAKRLEKAALMGIRPLPEKEKPDEIEPVEDEEIEEEFEDEELDEDEDEALEEEEEEDEVRA